MQKLARCLGISFFSGYERVRRSGKVPWLMILVNIATPQHGATAPFMLDRLTGSPLFHLRSMGIFLSSAPRQATIVRVVAGSETHEVIGRGRTDSWCGTQALFLTSISHSSAASRGRITHNATRYSSKKPSPAGS